MFDQLAPRYDLANRVLSLGLDQRWRKQAIGQLGPLGTVLDLCAGTLDLTRMLVDAGADQVIAVDFSAQMLAIGSAKIHPGEPVRTERADARSLPLDDQSVDGIICGFGLRNVPELPTAIAECARVLRPGGRMVVLDFFQPDTVLSRVLQSTYNKGVVPIVGGAITGFGDAYRYLNQSIDAFETADAFTALLAEHGLDAVHRSTFPPVASIVTATRLDHD
jgi:ubiquinone/menaquinone biosynthesis methyltransferase